MPRQVQTGSISNLILETLAATSELFKTINGVKYLPYELMWGKSFQGLDKKSVQKALSRSIKVGTVKRRLSSQGEILLAITDLGKVLIENKKSHPKLTLAKKEKPWDGRYRFIFFDIPEKDRFIRDILRDQLKLIGAVNYQRSVWVTKENITRELNIFIQENSLDKYISIVEVREIYNPGLKRLLD